jgi:hypothetical protein
MSISIDGKRVPVSREGVERVRKDRTAKKLSDAMRAVRKD